MAARPLEIHPAALAELKSAVAWYFDQNQTAALNFVVELDRAIDLVVASPRHWPRSMYGTHKFVIRRFPFAIFYREKEAVVQVLAVAHGHRRPGYWKDRL